MSHYTDIHTCPQTPKETLTFLALEIKCPSLCYPGSLATAEFWISELLLPDAKATRTSVRGTLTKGGNSESQTQEQITWPAVPAQNPSQLLTFLARFSTWDCHNAGDWQSPTTDLLKAEAKPHSCLNSKCLSTHLVP